MNEMTAFLDALAADPEDRTARLVFADYLDETDDPCGERVRRLVRVKEALADVSFDPDPPDKFLPDQEEPELYLSKLNDVSAEIGRTAGRLAKAAARNPADAPYWLFELVRKFVTGLPTTLRVWIEETWADDLDRGAYTSLTGDPLADVAEEHTRGVDASLADFTSALERFVLGLDDDAEELYERIVSRAYYTSNFERTTVHRLFDAASMVMSSARGEVSPDVAFHVIVHTMEHVDIYAAPPGFREEWRPMLVGIRNLVSDCYRALVEIRSPAPVG